MFNAEEQKLLRAMIEEKLEEASSKLSFLEDDYREAGFTDHSETALGQTIETLESISRKINT